MFRFSLLLKMSESSIHAVIPWYTDHVHSTVIIKPTRPHRVSVNIGDMVKEHLAIVPNSIAAHPLTGYDKVGAYFGIYRQG